MKADNDMNVGGLVLCKKPITRNSTEYVFRWWREDLIYQSGWIFKISRWIKENLFSFSPWIPVGEEEWNCLVINNRNAMKMKLMKEALFKQGIDYSACSDNDTVELYGTTTGNYMIAGVDETPNPE